MGLSDTHLGRWGSVVVDKNGCTQGWRTGRLSVMYNTNGKPGENARLGRKGVGGAR